MPLHRPIPTCTDTAGVIHALRRASGEELSGDQRNALLADVRGNAGSTAKLRIDATTYTQADDRPNRNFVRFRDGALRAFARTFKGAPLLRDHNQHELLARGGTVVDSVLEVDEATGVSSIKQTIELVKPWAIEAALDGTLDRFSIGWRATGPVTCTVCGKEYARAWFGMAPSCEHEPGEEYEVRGGETRLAQAEFSAAEGVEVSGVSVPAVPETSVDDIRAALAARRLPSLPHEKESAEMPTIAQALRLAADAGETAILAEIERRDIALDAERRARTEAEARLCALQEEAAARRRAELMQLALREGKVIPNSPLFAKLEALAASSIGLAESLVAELPRVTFVGQGLASAAPAPAAENDATQLSATDAEICRQMGITPAQFIAQRKGRG